MTIPRRLIRTTPAETTEQVEGWWRRFTDLHPGWDFMTFRDPIDPANFPVSSPHWERCTSGAQRAGLVRLESLHRLGGFYCDSDMEPYRSFEPLTPLHAFAAWEDAKVVPDAVIGAEAGHPVIEEALHMAIDELHRGAWYSGPGVTTALFPGRDDVLLLPPGSLYTVHYKEKAKLKTKGTPAPWEFAQHWWHASWLPPEKR